MSRHKITFNVAPRYTPGSPALVDEATLTGIYGAHEQQRAEALGVAGIVEARWEILSPSGWLVQDMLTREVFFRYVDTSRKGPTPAQRTKARRLIEAHGPSVIVEFAS